MLANLEKKREAKAAQSVNLQSTGVDNAGRENLVFSKGEPAERSTVAPTASKKKKNKKKKNKNAINNPVGPNVESNPVELTVD